MVKQQQVQAEKLLQAHQALEQALRILEAKLRPETQTDLTDLRDTLTATQKHVLDHFYLEAQNGYLNSVRQREPRLQHAIESLENEHHQLLGTLASLREKVFAATTLDANLRDALQEWVHGLRRHESLENTLVQDAFNFDVSAED